MKLKPVRNISGHHFLVTSKKMRHDEAISCKRKKRLEVSKKMMTPDITNRILRSFSMVFSGLYSPRRGVLTEVTQGFARVSRIAARRSRSRRRRRRTGRWPQNFPEDDVFLGSMVIYGDFLS